MTGLVYKKPWSEFDSNKKVAWMISKPEKQLIRKLEHPDNLALNVPGIAHIIDSKKGFVYNFLWFLIIIFSGLICGYQIVDRLKTFASHPIESKFNLIQNRSVKFPSITLCPAESNYVQILNLHKTCDTFKLVDNNISINAIWEMMNLDGQLITAKINIGTALLTNTKELEISKKSVLTILGNCTTYYIEEPVRFQKDSYTIEFAFHFFSMCTALKQAYYYIHEDDEAIEYGILKGSKVIPTQMFITTALSARMFIALNHSAAPCKSSKEVSLCEKNCLENILKDEIKCKLPYMDIPNLADCDNTTDINVVAPTAGNLAMNIDYTENCSCPRKCESTLYTEELVSSIAALRPYEMLTILKIYFGDNVIDKIEEYYSYTFIPFICDVGGNLGLFLGLCIPTMFEIIESLFIYIFNRFLRKKITIQ